MKFCAEGLGAAIEGITPGFVMIDRGERSSSLALTNGTQRGYLWNVAAG